MKQKNWIGWKSLYNKPVLQNGKEDSIDTNYTRRRRMYKWGGPREIRLHDFLTKQDSRYLKSDFDHPLILLGWFLSLPLTGRLLSLQLLREGPQQAHKMFIPVSWSYTPKIKVSNWEKFIVRAKMSAVFVHIDQLIKYTRKREGIGTSSSNKPKCNKMYF